MKIRPDRARAILAAVLIGLFAGSPAALAQSETLPPDGSPPRKPPPSAQEDAKSQDELLASLLERLKTAKDAETAKVLEGAISKLWLRSGSDTIDLLMSQAVSVMSKGEFNEALSILDIVVRLAPDYAEGWNKRATVLYAKQELRRSQRDIARVLALEPNHFGAISGLGLVLRALGNKKAALAAFRQALTIHPFLPAAREAVEELTPEVEGRGI